MTHNCYSTNYYSGFSVQKDKKKQNLTQTNKNVKKYEFMNVQNFQF